MSEIHQTLRFGDLPVGVKFHHPITDEVYTKISSHKTYNASGPSYILIHLDVLVTLTKSIDFFSLDYSAKFVYEQTVYIKIARNRAKELANPDTTKHFEPSDSVSPL